MFNLQHDRMLPANWLDAYFTALLHFVSILLQQFVALSVSGLYALYYQHLNWAEVDLQLVVLTWPVLRTKLHSQTIDVAGSFFDIWQDKKHAEL